MQPTIASKGKTPSKVVKFSSATLAAPEYSKGDHGDYIVVHFGGTPELHPESITIHKPIGVTGLGTGKYVSTRTVDMHFLLQRSVNPDEAKIKRERNSLFLEFQVEKGNLVVKEGKYHYRSEKVAGDTDRDLRLLNSQKALDADRATERAKHDKSQEGKAKAAKFRYGRVLQEFMADDMKAEEKHLKDVFNDDPGMKAKVKDLTQGFETKGGPNADQPQVPIPFIREGAGIQEVHAELFRRVSNLFRGEIPKEKNPPKEEETSGGQGDLDVVKTILEELKGSIKTGMNKEQVAQVHAKIDVLVKKLTG